MSVFDYCILNTVLHGMCFAVRFVQYIQSTYSSCSLPMQEMQVKQVLGQEDLLEEEMATTPVFLTRKFLEQRSLVDYSPWGRKELDMTKHI